MGFAANTVDSPGALLKYRWIPCQVKMHDVSALSMQVNTLCAN